MIELTITQFAVGIQQQASPPSQVIQITQGIPGVGLPSGGDTGEVLRKLSGVDYAFEWVQLFVSDLGDVDTTGAGTNDLLAYDGSEWVATSTPTVDRVSFDTANPATLDAAGDLAWDDLDQALAYKTNGITVDIGQENLVYVRNPSGGSTLPKGAAVAVDGASSNRLRVKLCNSVEGGDGCRTLGVTMGAIPSPGFGFVSTFGLLRGFDTSTIIGGGVAPGSELFISSTPGVLSTQPQASPGRRVTVGYVVTTGTQGSIFVTVRRGLSVNELDNVHAPSPTDGQVIAYNSANSRYELATIADIAGAYPDTNPDGFLDATGVGAIVDARVPDPSGEADGRILVVDSGALVYDDASGGAVDSVNGQTGDVVLDASDIGFDGTFSGIPATNVQDAIDILNFLVVHGTDSNVARPLNAPIVLWRGTAVPANPIGGDLWDETQTFFSPDPGVWTYNGTTRLWEKGTDTVSVDWVSEHTVAAGGSVELNFGTSSGNRTIDWGDGTTPAIVNTARPTHTYTNAGTYQVRASGGTTTRLGDRGTSPVAAWTGTLTAVRSFGNLGWTSFSNGFQGVSGNFGVPQYLPTSVTNLGRIFGDCSSFNQPIGHWNTQNVTSMSAIFRFASSFNQPIGSWNLSNVTTTSDAFRSALAFNQDVTAWNTEKITTMASMFISAANFNQNLGGWQLRLAGVTMSTMLQGTGISTENYSRTLIGWANYVNANSDTPAAVTLGAGTLTYNATSYTTGQTYNDAVSARAYLVGSPPGWTIADGGAV
jgi:surface protein